MAKKTMPTGGDPSATANPTPPASDDQILGDEHHDDEGDQHHDDAGDDRPAASLEAADESNYEATLLATLPDRERELPGALLFAEACVVFGVNPDPAIRPIEILHATADPRFKFYAGDPQLTPPTPDRIKFVTAGGVKVCHPIDADFEAILRKWFRTSRINPRTREAEELPLPDDLTLPREAVTGLVQKVEHRYAGGYLRRKALERARGDRG